MPLGSRNAQIAGSYRTPALCCSSKCHPDQIFCGAPAAERDRLADEALLLAERAILVFCEQRVDAVPVLALHQPGAIALTLMPYLIRLSPADWVRLITDNFVAQ